MPEVSDEGQGGSAYSEDRKELATQVQSGPRTSLEVGANENVNPSRMRCSERIDRSERDRTRQGYIP